MDTWRVAVLGGAGVGKTALAVQVLLNKFLMFSQSDPTSVYTQLFCGLVFILCPFSVLKLTISTSNLEVGENQV
jgi:GTPase SAR1 family protein